ncbi:MAG: glycerate kinase [Lachnospiraceae bacterium]|nr:glycerate kinase [Lachnospiraceae bacterium]
MKVVIAVDSFKGSMSSMEAGEAAREGVLLARDASVVVRPLADGGEGTTEALVEGLGGSYVDAEVSGPLSERVRARYGILGDGRTAVMEMAKAAGITLVKREALNPWLASTVGVGEMIRDAIGRGCREFMIGIGGSATTEGGIGMLQALGYEFYDRNGQLLPPRLDSLGEIARIDDSHVMPELDECYFRVACDVTNPLCGENGAVYVYGPQKGVKREECALLDEKLRHYAEETGKFLRKKNGAKKGENSCGNCEDGRTGWESAACYPGAGAAGGLGFAFLSYLPHAELKPGISIVLDAIRLEEELADADIVLTGEGRLDGQTAMGKAPVGVARLAKKHGCRVIAFAGSVAEDAAVCNTEGIDAFFPIVRGVTTLAEAMNPENAKNNMRRAVEQVFRLL